MKKLILLCSIILFIGCETPTQFSEKALNDVAYSLDGKQITIKQILNKHKGKKVLIDVWAAWCADCIKGLPKVKLLQKEFPDVVFLFLSVDKNSTQWKRGIQRFKIVGEHYNLPKGMKKGDFVDFIGLSWIPRYIVISETGEISLFKATNANDSDITKALKQ